MTLERLNLKTPVIQKNLSQIELRINYQILSQEIIKNLRGVMSQRQLSEKLGFTFNQVGKWESGATQIKWDDFLNLTEVLNIPLEKYFGYSFVTNDGDFNALSSLQILIKKLNLLKTADSRYRLTLKRWVDGETMPILADVLKMMGSKSSILFGWLSLFLDCTHINSLKEYYDYFLKNVEIVLKDPIVVYVNAALQLQAYKELAVHDDHLLAEHSACSIAELKKALSILMTYGLVSFDGKKYQHCPYDFSFSGLRHPKLRSLTKHTTCLAAARYPEAPITIDPNKVRNPSQSSVRVTALSAVAAQKVADLIVLFHNQVDEIVKNDQLPKDNVQILLVHSFASNINTPKTNI